MKNYRLGGGLAAALAAGALILTTLSTSPADAANPSGNGARHAKNVCATLTTSQLKAAATATCSAQVMADADGTVPHATTPPAAGMTPAKLKAAYNLTGLTSGGKTVAIVDAYGYTNLESDLATYRSYYGLPACTKASGCLKILNQTGGTSSLPRMDVGWAGEQALDVDAVSAICPDCKIVVVQAKSASFTDLGTAVNTAAAQSGVVAISNSYGGSDAPDSTYGSYYNHPGIAVTASTGDSGYVSGGSFPADSAYVVAVGGTTLTTSTAARGWAETAWSGAGSGCSTYNTALSAASSFSTGCSKRAVADVSAAADPANGGMAIYWPTSKTASSWAQVGGTSESSPIIAAVFALGTNSLSGYPNALPYSHTSSLYDVTSGSNGSCPTTQWCSARTGWDGPTGLGTPNGVGAF